MAERFQWPQTDDELETFKLRSRDAAIKLYRQAVRRGDLQTQENLCRLAPLLFITRRELEACGGTS
jgi:hypothetical protein